MLAEPAISIHDIRASTANGDDIELCAVYDKPRHNMEKGRPEGRPFPAGRRSRDQRDLLNQYVAELTSAFGAAGIRAIAPIFPVVT